MKKDPSQVADQIFQVLLLDGYIEAGDYLIKVSW
jgi:hypothetical protein